MTYSLQQNVLREITLCQDSRIVSETMVRCWREVHWCPMSSQNAT